MFIIQIGAGTGIHDGHRDIDEVYTLITENSHTKAVLIEPSPDNFTILQQNYKKYLDRVILLNNAVALHNGTIQFYEVHSDTFMGEASTLKEELLAKKDYYNGTTKDYSEIIVECCNINTLLERYDIPDYLVIDAEGYDGEILESLDLQLYPIKKIRFEFSHISMEQLGKICLKLLKLDYVISHDKADFIAEKK